MGILPRFLAFIGRGCLSLLFIVLGLQQLLDWQGTEQAIIKSLNDWSAMKMGDENWRVFFATALSWSSIIVAATIFFQLIGGLCLLLGILVRFGAFVLICVLIPATVAHHAFWMEVAPERAVQLMAFLKNLSLFGALCIILAYGKGCRVVEARPPKPPSE